MARDGGYSDQWDDSESGGVPCACGKHCAEADYVGNPSRGPRAFCETDRARIASVIKRLPETYAELSLKLVKSQQQEERVSGSREAPVPVDLDVQAFMRHIVLVALTWEDLVRGAANLSDPDLCPECEGEGSAEGWDCQACEGSGVVKSRDGAALKRACDLLGGRDGKGDGHLTALLALEPSDTLRPVKGSTKLAELEPGSVIRIDSSGDAWQRREMDGTAAGVEFLKLHSRARGILGLAPRTRRVAARCETDGGGCGSIGTIKQREAPGGDWEAVARCTACPKVYAGADFEDLMGREFQAVQRAERNAS